MPGARGPRGGPAVPTETETLGGSEGSERRREGAGIGSHSHVRPSSVIHTSFEGLGEYPPARIMTSSTPSPLMSTAFSVCPNLSYLHSTTQGSQSKLMGQGKAAEARLTDQGAMDPGCTTSVFCAKKSPVSAVSWVHVAEESGRAESVSSCWEGALI